MSGIDELISIGIEDPEYYAELLSVTPRDVSGRLLSDERPGPDIPGIHDPIAQRLQTLLDVVAHISLCQKGNVSATLACIRQDKDALETQVYVTFNHEDDEAARSCPKHLQSIFGMLHQVPYRPSARDGSPKVIEGDLEGKLIEICRAIHNYSYDIFEYRVYKRRPRLSEIRGYIEQERMHFTLEQHSMLMNFLQHVDAIIDIVADARHTKQFSNIAIQIFINIYWYWKNHNLLPKDEPADNKFTLLDLADARLAEAYKIDFQLRRWAMKIMSFVISANRLFRLTQSRRLRNILDGKFTVQVLSSPTTTPYHCNLSSETMQMAVDTALAEAGYHPANLDEERAWFMEALEKRLEVCDVVHKKPTVHAELALIIAKAEGKINNVEPYIGVSKLSCIMCSHYIRAFNEVMKEKFTTKGSHGKAYTGWFWPKLPSRDGELRAAFLKLIREQLSSDFKEYAKSRRLSDSSVGSELPGVDVHATGGSISGMVETYIRTEQWQ